jgi:ketosteroid isomerase-like protein
MSVDASVSAASALTDPARIRELMLDNLFAVFNERDQKRRLGAIARNYTEDVIWSDPDGTIRGHEAMNEQAQKLLDRMPKQPPAVSGVDVALVRDGRIAVLHTLLTA